MGTDLAMPPKSAIARVWRRSYNMPMMRNSAPVEMPWLTIWMSAPWTASASKANTPSTTKPRWLTDEYATSFLMSVCANATIAP